MQNDYSLPSDNTRLRAGGSALKNGNAATTIKCTI